MAQYSSHVYSALGVAVCYSFIGLLLLGVDGELATLSMLIVFLAGLLPDVDNKSSPSTTELIGLIAIFPTIALLYLAPSLRMGNISRLTIVIVISYALSRVLINKLLTVYTERRGMLHSLPASIIVMEITYLTFFDLFWTEKLFIAFGAFVGYSSHLILDAFSRVDSGGKIVTGDLGLIPVMKLLTKDPMTNWITYLLTISLGWVVFRDIYPQINAYSPALSM